MTAKLRQAGAQGWELAGTNTLFTGAMSTAVVWCFKRPVVAPAAPPPPPPPPPAK